MTMVLFALSCVGLLLFLWLSFGGEVPFNPRGYRFQVAFPDAQQLASQADVRIAGVTVGKVVDKELDPNGNKTRATIQINNKYAPIHVDATAILRTKTLLGETYIDLTPGSRHAKALPDNGVLARGDGSGMTCNGTPCGHYLRQFGMAGGESLSIYQNRPPTNRGNTYPEPILTTPAVGQHESLPAWDCNNTGGQHGPVGDQPTGQPACWVAPPLGRYLGQPQKFPHVLAARYPNR
jgi:hypothetical protein